MRYGIKPLGNIDDIAYAWRFSNLTDAKEQAYLLSKTHNVEVLVFEIIGAYASCVTWEVL